MDQPMVLYLRAYLGCPCPSPGTFCWRFIRASAEQAGGRQLGCAGGYPDANLPRPALLQVSCQQTVSGDLPETTGSPPAHHCHGTDGISHTSVHSPNLSPLKEEKQDGRFCRFAPSFSWEGDGHSSGLSWTMQRAPSYTGELSNADSSPVVG